MLKGIKNVEYYKCFINRKQHVLAYDDYHYVRKTNTLSDLCKDGKHHLKTMVSDLLFEAIVVYI